MNELRELIDLIKKRPDSKYIPNAYLAFGELLPAKPGWLEQHEYEQQHGVAFALDRIGKRVCDGPKIIHITNPDYQSAGDGNDSQ